MDDEPQPTLSRTAARAGGSVAGAAALVAAVTAVSRLSGFGREAVTAAVYGASAEFDAYLVASGIPNVVIALLSTAIVTAAIPVIAARVRGDATADGQRLFRTLALGVTVAVVAASAVMAVLTPEVVGLVAPGFGPAQRQLTVELTRILLLSAVLVAAMNLVSGLLQVHRRFFWPAFVGIPFNVAMVVAAVLFGMRYGVVALAWGFVVGSLLRVAVQLPALRRTGFRWLGGLRLSDDGLRSVAALVPVILLGHLTSTVNTFVDRIVGSGLDAGAISALNYAYRLMTLPHGLLVMALVQVLYPAFGSLAAIEDRGEFAALSTRGLAVLSCLIVPIAATTAVLAEPVVQVVYGRGNFDAEAVDRTALALAAYAPGLLALGLRDLALRGLYGLQDATLPAVVAVVSMAVNVVGDLTLGRRFGVVGLAASTSLSFAVAAALAVGLLAARHRAVRPRPLLACLARNAVAVLPAAAAAVALRTVFAPDGGTVAAATTVAVAGGAGLTVHLFGLWLLRAPELAELRRLTTLVRGRGRRS